MGINSLFVINHKSSLVSENKPRFASCSFVNHDFAEDCTEHTTVPVCNSGRLDVHVARLHRFLTLHVKPRLEESVVESRHEATDVAWQVDLLLAGLVVDIDNQLVQVVHVILVSRSGISSFVSIFKTEFS